MYGIIVIIGSGFYYFLTSQSLGSSHFIQHSTLNDREEQRLMSTLDVVDLIVHFNLELAMNLSTKWWSRDHNHSSVRITILRIREAIEYFFLAVV